MAVRRLPIALLGVLCVAWGARDVARILDLPVSIAATIAELGGELGTAGLARALAAPIVIAALSALGALAGAIALGRRVTARRAARVRRQPAPLPDPVSAAQGRL
jgi:hypothetical protein